MTGVPPGVPLLAELGVLAIALSGNALILRQRALAGRLFLLGCFLAAVAGLLPRWRP